MVPDVFNAAPELADGWTLRIEGEVVVCDSPRGPLYDGRLETPHDWLEVLKLERRCLVLVAGIGVNSDAIGPGFEPALNLLASKGLVAGGTAEVNGLLGLYAAQGMATAKAAAQQIKSLTANSQQR
jgi:hypothetical protein